MLDGALEVARADWEEECRRQRLCGCSAVQEGPAERSAQHIDVGDVEGFAIAMRSNLMKCYTTMHRLDVLSFAKDPL